MEQHISSSLSSHCSNSLIWNAELLCSLSLVFHILKFIISFILYVFFILSCSHTHTPTHTHIHIHSILSHLCLAFVVLITGLLYIFSWPILLIPKGLTQKLRLHKAFPTGSSLCPIMTELWKLPWGLPSPEHKSPSTSYAKRAFLIPQTTNIEM